MLIDFFIKRPIFTGVCSIIIVVLGLICYPLLPVAQYPELAPPMIKVTSTYIGASSEVVESAVTKPLEKAINGVEDMKYMSSQSGNNGVSTINITFNLGKDKDIAAVDVQNKISPVTGQLPEEVTKTGISIEKTTTSIVAGYAFFSPNSTYSDEFISNYIDQYIVDPIKRIKGVGDVTIAGERKYAMRLWIDPNLLIARGLTPEDIVTALQEQNIQVPAGQIGQPPSPDNQLYQLSIKVQGRLESEKEFDQIVLKADENGNVIKVKDIGYSELGSEDYSTKLNFDGKSAIGLLVYQQADANSIQLYDELQKELKTLEKTFPPGFEYKKAFDTVQFVKESIHEVEETLYIAIFLVILVIFLFLQSWRATVIPLVTIPVSLIGTFAFIKVFDFSINTLTLFGLVLAIGIVVDDAIVVVENIERNMEEFGMTPAQAASASMKEVASAIIAASLVLGAVFLPVAAFPGTTGQLYKQFALTIVFSVLISLFNAMTLSPSLSALILKKDKPEPKGIGIIFNKFLNRVEQFIVFSREKYFSGLKFVVHHKYPTFIVFIALIIGCLVLLKTVPTGFVPNEDQGYFIMTVQAPEGVSLAYTNKVMSQIKDKVLDNIEEIEDIFAFSGFSFSGNSPNNGVLFVALKDFNERIGKQHSAKNVVLKVNKQLAKITDAIVVAFEPPAIQGMGNVGGFQYMLLDIAGGTLQDLADKAMEIVTKGNSSPELTGLFSGFKANTPQIEVKVERDKAKAIGIPLSNIFNTLQISLGSVYVNDFNYMDRVYRVYVQAQEYFRNTPDVIGEYYVKSQTTGKIVPLSSLIKMKARFTSNTITHFNLFRSAEIDGVEAPGYSSGQAMSKMEELSKELLPQGMDFQWAGISLEQEKAGVTGLIMFAMGILFVYLFLAAQYESIIDPFIILLAVPLAVFGALLAQLLAGLQNDVYCQVGLVMLIGMACKNSILIVEFANHLLEHGKNLEEAVLEAAKTRFRPIVMTSMAFILGVFPLAIATGAGAASRNSLGTAVMGGMIFATFISLFFVPVLFLLLKRFSRKQYPYKMPKKLKEEN